MEVVQYPSTITPFHTRNLPKLCQLGLQCLLWNKFFNMGGIRWPIFLHITIYIEHMIQSILKSQLLYVHFWKCGLWLALQENKIWYRKWEDPRPDNRSVGDKLIFFLHCLGQWGVGSWCWTTSFQHPHFNNPFQHPRFLYSNDNSASFSFKNFYKRNEIDVNY